MIFMLYILDAIPRAIKKSTFVFIPAFESQIILYYIQMQINSHICGLSWRDKFVAIFTSYATHRCLPSCLVSKGKVRVGLG